MFTQGNLQNAFMTSLFNQMLSPSLQLPPAVFQPVKIPPNASENDKQFLTNYNDYIKHKAFLEQDKKTIDETMKELEKLNKLKEDDEKKMKENEDQMRKLMDKFNLPTNGNGDDLYKEYVEGLKRKKQQDMEELRRKKQQMDSIEDLLKKFNELEKKNSDLEKKVEELSKEK